MILPQSKSLAFVATLAYGAKAGLFVYSIMTGATLGFAAYLLLDFVSYYMPEGKSKANRRENTAISTSLSLYGATLYLETIMKAPVKYFMPVLNTALVLSALINIYQVSCSIINLLTDDSQKRFFKDLSTPYASRR